MFDNLFTPSHLLILLGIAVLFFGGRKLPELGKGLGDGIRSFHHGIKGLTESGRGATEIPPKEL